MRSSSPLIARAVSAITGIARVASSCLSSAVAFRPSMPGSWISIRTRWGCSARAIVSPASASVALSTVWPADCSRNVANAILAGLSSITRMTATSGDLPPPRQRAPNLGGKQLGVESGLVHDRRHVASEVGVLLGRDVLGGDHQHRDPGGIGVFVGRSQHIEAVYFR